MCFLQISIRLRVRTIGTLSSSSSGINLILNLGQRCLIIQRIHRCLGIRLILLSLGQLVLGISKLVGNVRVRWIIRRNLLQRFDVFVDSCDIVIDCRQLVINRHLSLCLGICQIISALLLGIFNVSLRLVFILLRFRNLISCVRHYISNISQRRLILYLIQVSLCLRLGGFGLTQLRLRIIQQSCNLLVTRILIS